MDFVSRLESKLKSLEKPPRKKSTRKKTKTPGSGKQKKIKVVESTTTTGTSISFSSVSSTPPTSSTSSHSLNLFPQLDVTQLSPMKDRTTELTQLHSKRRLAGSRKPRIVTPSKEAPPAATLSVASPSAALSPSPSASPSGTPSATPTMTPVSSPCKKMKSSATAPAEVGDGKTIQEKEWKEKKKHRSPQSRSTVPTPTPMSSSSVRSTKQHVARQIKAQQQKQYQQQRASLFHIEDVANTRQMTESVAETKSRERHLQRQEKGRQIRERKSRNRLGSPVPDTTVGVHYVYESIQSKEERLLRQEEEKKRQQLQDLINDAERKEAKLPPKHAPVHAVVLNHTTNLQHSYQSQPEGRASPIEGEEEGEEEGEGEGEEVKNNVETVGMVYSSHDHNVFAAIDQGMGEKKESAGSQKEKPVYRGTGLKVSDLFDDHSPYHPRCTNTSDLIASSPAKQSLTPTQSKGARNQSSNTNNAVSGDWQNIFNGSGTKRRAIQKRKKETMAQKQHENSVTWTRIKQQRDIMKKLSSQHMESVVAKGTVKESNRPLVTKHQHAAKGLTTPTREGRDSQRRPRLRDFHSSQQSSQNFSTLMAKAHKTTENLQDVLSLLSKT